VEAYEGKEKAWTEDDEERFVEGAEVE